MDYKAAKNFRLNCIVRVVALGATIALLVLLIPKHQHFTLALLSALIIGQTWSLIGYVEYTNRSLNLFLQSIDFGDFSSRVATGPSGKSFSGLVDVFNRILAQFRETSTAREENLRYLMAVIQHVAVGVLVYNQDGDVVLLNNSARRLLDIPRLDSLAKLAIVYPELVRTLRDDQPRNRDLMTLSVGGELRQIAIQTSEVKQRQQTLFLVSLQNISPELNEKEMDAWRNLIRILTHEIKNSLTPIASLAASVEQMTMTEATQGDNPIGSGRPPTQPRKQPLEPAKAGKVQEALQIIQKRSQGLLHFIDSYRDLTHIPAPELSYFHVADLFARVESLITPELSLLTSTIDPPTMKLSGDSKLLEQVLINLVLNALDALHEQPDPKIELRAYFDKRSRPIIEVIDNGPGILAESIEKVFIPFYSTKPEGTGIGLSWSRQILRMHRGDLSVTSDPGVETIFTLRF
jgi:signal transduction histidine kinase